MLTIMTARRKIVLVGWNAAWNAGAGFIYPIAAFALDEAVSGGEASGLFLPWSAVFFALYGGCVGGVSAAIAMTALNGAPKRWSARKQAILAGVLGGSAFFLIAEVITTVWAGQLRHSLVAGASCGIIAGVLVHGELRRNRLTA